MNPRNIFGEFCKLPETIEEAIDYVNSSELYQATIDDLAFKKVVTNVLITSGLVTDEDFDSSINYFKDQLTRKYAESVLEQANRLRMERADASAETAIPILPEDEPDQLDPLVSDDDYHKA